MTNRPVLLTILKNAIVMAAFSSELIADIKNKEMTMKSGFTVKSEERQGIGEWIAGLGACFKS